MKDAFGHGSNAHLGAAIKARRANSPFGHAVVPVSGGEPHGLVATAAKQLADNAKNGATKPHEIVNSRTGDTFGRTFSSKAEAAGFVKQLQSNTNTKLHWTPRRVKN